MLVFKLRHLVRTCLVMTKIGLIADTHMPGSLANLWPEAIEAFADVDCILHAGDLHTLDIVDELSALAPTYVARGNGDVGLIDERLRDHWILEFAGVKIAMMHHFPSPERKSAEVIERYIAKHLKATPDVVVFGHTHFEGIYQVGNTLCINPGSPTLPRNQSMRRGTLAYLDIGEVDINASIHQISAEGIVPHGDVLPVSHARVIAG